MDVFWLSVGTGLKLVSPSLSHGAAPGKGLTEGQAPRDGVDVLGWIQGSVCTAGLFNPLEHSL